MGGDNTHIRVNLELGSSSYEGTGKWTGADWSFGGTYECRRCGRPMLVRRVDSREVLPALAVDNELCSSWLVGLFRTGVLGRFGMKSVV
jgi:hypothetical protein